MRVTKLWRGVFLLGATVLSGQAFGHARLLSSVPASGSAMSAAPANVSLSFSEALEPRFSSVMVTNASGARADKNDLTVAPGDAKTVRIDLNPLNAGTYTVKWRAVSVDTHRTQGVFSFTVKR
jgi:methionine-rich copper-binding protein CopC